MSDTVGRIDLILDVDGKGLPGKVRRAGEKAGDEAGEGFNDKFDDQITKGAKERNKQIGNEGRKAGESYSDARDRILQKRNKGLSDRLSKAFETPKGLSEYVNRFDTAQDAIANMREELKELRKQNLITDEDFKRNNATLTQNRRALIRAKDAANDFAKKQADIGRAFTEATSMNKEFDRAVQTNQKNIAKWRKEIEVNLNRSLANLAARQRQAEKDTKAFERAQADAEKQSQRLRQEMDRLRISTGNVFRDGDKGIDRYVNKFPTVREGVTKLRDEIVKLRESQTISSDEFEKSITHLTAYTRNIKDLDTGLSRVEKSSGRATNGVKKFNGQARQMPYVLKAIIGYTALFTALAPGIAVLGSASGSGLLSLATGAGALALAVVTLIPAFKGMLSDLDKLPEKARPAAQALQDMKGPLSDLQDTIQEGVFDGLAPSIQRLTSRIFPRLERGFGKTAKTINGLFRDLISGLTSDDSLGRMDDIFDGLQPILKDLGGAVFDLLGAFSKLFQAALPSGQKLAGFLHTILGDFNAWTSSGPGTEALTKFFDHLDEIMPSVGRLLASAGKSVAGFVTDKAVDNMTSFLDTMANVIPTITGPLGHLIDVIDPLGLAAKVLQGLGKVLPDVVDNLAKGLEALDTPEVRAAIKENLPKLLEGIKDISKALPAAGRLLGDVLPGAIKLLGDAAKVAAPPVQLLAAGLDSLMGNAKDAKKDMAGIDWDGFAKGIKGVNDALGTNAGFSLQKLLGISDKDVDLSTKAGKANTAAFLEGMKNVPGLGTIFSDLAKIITGDKGGETIFSKAGREKIGLFLEGLSDVTGFSLLKPIAGLFEGKDLSDAMDKAGAKAISDFFTGLDKGLRAIPGGGLIADLLDKITGVDTSDRAKTKGASLGGSFGGGVKKGIDDSKEPVGTSVDGLTVPFTLVNGKITGFLAGIPGAIGGIFNTITGQPGADKASNPFSKVVGNIRGFVADAPGTISRIFGQITGEAGSNKASSPFSKVVGVIRGFVNPVPGLVSGIMNLVSGQKGADKTSSPFSKVKGKVSSFLGGIGGVVNGALSSVSGQSAADRIVSAFANVKQRISTALSGIGGLVSGVINGAKAAVSAGVAAVRSNIPKTAIGGTFSGAQMRIIGEAGPEAVVPLNRPLSQVDPSVRALSALAQGKFPAAAASGAQKVNNVNEGAIMVVAASDNVEQVASSVLDNLIAKL